MKKFGLLLAAVLLLTVLFPMSAFAHGHRGGGTFVNYGYCTVENCTISYSHHHENMWYGGYTTQGGYGGCHGGWHQ